MHLLKEASVSGKSIFLRADLDVPIIENKITGDTRLVSVIPTIEYLLKKSAKIIIAGHLGRPEGVDKKLTLEPVAKWFEKKLSTSSLKFSVKGEFNGWEIGENIFLLENLRFFKGEEENDPEFSKKLASLADLYVNDAFAICHRKHASIVGITKLLPHFAGLHLEKEVEVLSKVLKNPERPLAVIIGGAKIETKIPLVEVMHHVADYVMVGGKLAEEVKTLLKIQHEKLISSASGNKTALLIADLNDEGTDITQKSAENFLQIVGLAKTVIWNGPLGKISENKKELVKSEEGSKRIAEGLVRSGAYTIVGGGDTIGFLEKACLLDNFACMSKDRCFISTGGGAMLSLLSGEKLPGVEALL